MCVCVFECVIVCVCVGGGVYVYVSKVSKCNLITGIKCN